MTQFRRGTNWNIVSGGDSMSPFCATDVRIWATGSPKTRCERSRRQRTASKPPEGLTRTGRRAMTTRCIERTQLARRSVRARRGRARCAPQGRGPRRCRPTRLVQPTHTSRRCCSCSVAAQQASEELQSAPRRRSRSWPVCACSGWNRGPQARGAAPPERCQVGPASAASEASAFRRRHPSGLEQRSMRWWACAARAAH